MTSRFPPFAFVELVSPYNKKNITRWLEDMNFMFSWQEQYLTRSLRSLVRYCSCHSNIKFISSRHRVISSIYNTNIDKNWTPILEIIRKFRISKKNSVHILRRQFPLRPAAAKTIHRSQGDTSDETVVDFPKYEKEDMHYVALSRVRNSSTLHVLNLNENKIKVSEKVKKEMKRLRTHATMVPLAVLRNTNLQESFIMLIGDR